MYKLILILLFTSVCFSQIRLNRAEYFTASVVVDPCASIKEKGLNIGVEIEYVGSIYTRASFTNFAALKDGYTDITGAVGVSLTSGYFERTRYYAGGRLGFIYRASVYPTAGVESGIDLMITDNIFIGVRSTYDYRSDQEYYGSPNVWRYSGFVKTGIKF